MATNPQPVPGGPKRDVLGRLTPDESAQMNQRMRELHYRGVRRKEIHATLNAEFGVHFSRSSYCDRERTLGLRIRGERATGDESRQLNGRIRQLWEQQTPGREMVTIINREFARNFGPGAIYHRAENMGLKVIRARPRPSASRECVPEEQWETAYHDPAWEARNNITDQTACRECFRLDQPFRLYRNLYVHLKAQHGMNFKKYRQLHPAARVISFQQVADDTGRSCQELMREFADSYATPTESAQAAKGQEYYDQNGITDYVICCVERCGLKAAALSHHLRSVHRMSGSEYRRKYGPLPITPVAILEKMRAKSKAVRLAAWRPTSWWAKPADWRIMGTELLSEPGYISNLELIERLRAARMIDLTHYGKTSKEIANNRAFAKLVNEVRKWVGRPGRKVS